MLLPFIFSAMMADKPLQIETDLARYSPGQSVRVRIDGPDLPGAKLYLRFYHLGEQVGREKVSTWSSGETVDWQPPVDGGHGYLAVAELVPPNGKAVAQAFCGIDVSERWTDFPRYGYVSHFGPEVGARSASIVKWLTRFHIDGIQFYDWQWKHHHPLPESPTWRDIAKREISGNTVRSLISEAHQHNEACMAYNLGFGGVDGYDQDGISPDWLLYYDKAAKSPYALNMPAGWETSKLFIFNPGDPAWQSAIFPREKAAVEGFKFDGWHMDQLGDLGKVYTVNGSPVVLKDGFPSLLAGAKASVPGALIFNNVGGYGLEESLKSPQDAIYLEAWHWMGQKTFIDLKRTIEQMRSSGKAAILAAYMDYEVAKKYQDKVPGTFNLPGVLLADATIFASGGFHLELGDQGKMLDNEYFPNHNLEPSTELLSRLQNYYDFAVAYEDLLSAQDVVPSSVSVLTQGHVWSFARQTRDGTVVHLINLASPGKNEWRDPEGSYSTPTPIKGLGVTVQGNWHSAYAVSPDQGQLNPIPLTIKNGTVVVPQLYYWTMLVLR